MTFPEQFGPYQLHELVNSGGMADLFIATNPAKETVAIRRLHPTSLFDLTPKRRFVRGCEVLAKICHHDFVVQYFGHGKIDGRHYLCMEYVEGDNLKMLAANGDEVLAENIGNILIEMAQALEHVQDCGYMHLDFKPENVVLSRNASLRLVDFDLSLPKPDKPEKLAENPGTPAYMSPEQLMRQPVDHRADIFAYGASAFELLSGQKAFPGDSADEILRKQLDRSDFQDLRSHNPEVPAALERIVLKCLETDPDRRYPNMAVLVRDLQIALYV